MTSFANTAYSQNKKDSSMSKEIPVSKLPAVADTLDSKKADSVINKHSPHTAAVRSAILPGLGQIYNKKYWKLPLVYGGLGISGYVFFDNIKTYKDLRFAYKVIYNINHKHDSTGYDMINPLYTRLSESSLRSSRDEFRRNVDYSVLVFVILWSLNIVDASVDANLKAFDVSPDLGLHLKAGYSEMANTNGVSLILTFK